MLLENKLESTKQAQPLPPYHPVRFGLFHHRMYLLLNIKHHNGSRYLLAFHRGNSRSILQNHIKNRYRGTLHHISKILDGDNLGTRDTRAGKRLAPETHRNIPANLEHQLMLHYWKSIGLERDKIKP